MKKKYNRLLGWLTPFQWFGVFVMACCLTVILPRLSISTLNEVIISLISPQSISILATGGILIGIISLAGGEAWHSLLKADNIDVQHRLALGLFATGVFSGYLPKKLIRMDARQYIVDMFGYPYSLVLNSSVWLVMLNAVAGLLLAMVFLILNLSGLMKWIFLISVLFVYGFGLHTLSKLIEFSRMRALMIFVLIHILSILIPLVSMAYIIDTPFEKMEVALIATVAMISWLIGYVIPGVPAGVFVREYIFLLLLSPWIPISHVLLVITIYRVQFFIGRGALYGLGLWIQQHDMFNIASSIDLQRFHSKN